MHECEDPARELVPGYIDGTLTKAEIKQAEQHLVACDICRELLATLLRIRTPEEGA